LEALLARREVSFVSVYSPTQAKREAFAADFQKSHGIKIGAAGSAQAAVANVDLILCAARSHDETPTLEGQWVMPGTVIVSVGSTLPEQRELDAGIMDRAALIVADMPEEVLHETGDALAAIEAGVDVAGKLVSLSNIGTGKVPARKSPDDILIYKCVFRDAREHPHHCEIGSQNARLQKIRCPRVVEGASGRLLISHDPEL
jgi:alanine dehydrogenase